MSKSLDRLTLLATFARIAERGSISAAARDVGLSQASASRQLAELETRLGVQLVQRTTHTLSLTEAGRDCLTEARVLLAGWDALEERFAEERTALSGKLKVVAPVALGQLDLADAALTFQQDHPEVTITWVLQDGPIRFSEIGCDLWIKVGPVPDDSLVVRALGQVERLIVAAPGLLGKHPPTEPSGLSNLPCAALDPFEGDRITLTHQDGGTDVVRADVALTTNNIFSAKQAALRGIGYAVMPRWLVAEELAGGRLIDVLPTWRAAALTIHAAYLPSQRQTRRLRAFIDHMAGAVLRITESGSG